MKIETLIDDGNKVENNNERYTSKSVLNLGEQLAARFREKRPLFPEK